MQPLARDQHLPSRLAAALSLVVFMTAACDVSEPAPAGISLPATRRPPVPSGVLETCGGVAIPATLAGDPHDPRVVWRVGFTDGRRTDVVRPAGYRAVFNPELEVLSADASVMLRGGEFVD